MADDFTSYEYTGWKLEVFIGVFLPLQVVAVAARFYAQTFADSKFGLDDWLVIASLLGQFVTAGICIGAVEQGAVGYHVEYLERVNPGAVTLFFQYFTVLSAWYYVTVTITKLAICVLYLRLFPQRSVLVLLYITAAVMILMTLAHVIVSLAGCRPFSANWAPIDVQATHCINREAFSIWSTFPNVLTNVVLLALPLPIVWSLHTSTQTKVALTFTFVIGSHGLVASILRFSTLFNTRFFIDAPYHAVTLLVWNNVEPGLYLISACLLKSRPLLDRLNIWFKGSVLERTRGYVSRAFARKHKLHDPEASVGNRSIALRARNMNEGFERLPEDGETLTNNIHIPQSSVIIITNTRQTREDA
ncbi:hypothetical protein HD806DRAFT_478908 [Xylariaceae sp. AK1471]|nr:hypothetical protein HD806DRAFT_478908 [Xylariaceae sp. AK1471]